MNSVTTCNEINRTNVDKTLIYSREEHNSRAALVSVIQPVSLAMKEMTESNPAAVSPPSDSLRGIVTQSDDLPLLPEGRSNKQLAGF